jgi:tripartite ATP-independent transporter DctP family solute receptor
MNGLIRGLLVAGLSAWGCLAQAQIEIRFGHVGEPNSLYDITAQEFVKQVNAKLAGKAKITLYGSSQLGGDKEMLQKMKLGTMEMSLPSTVMSSEADVFGLFEMPYLVKDRQHLAKIEKEIVIPKMYPAAEAKGLKILAMWENGYRHLTNNKHPIRVPADLRGIKLRVPEGKWRVKMFQAYGANPSPMKFSELFTALSTGVMDGQENPLPQIFSAKLYEVQKYLSLSGHVYAPVYLAVGAKKWATLPADVRQVIEVEAKSAQAFCYATADRLDQEWLDKMKAAGIQVNEVDKEAFIKASGPIYAEFGKEVAGAQEMIDRAIALGK